MLSVDCLEIMHAKVFLYLMTGNTAVVFVAERSASLRVVGNVAWFYGQFVPHVNAFLLEQQKPIRKEMRGFISVIKWGDYIGFWTMKENVDRCKKTIHKHVSATSPVVPFNIFSHGLVDSASWAPCAMGHLMITSRGPRVPLC